MFDVSWLVHYGAASRQYKDLKVNRLSVGGTVYALGTLLWALSRADARTNSTSDVVMCFDSPTDRKSILPGYKSSRVYSPMIAAQIKLLRYHLERLGIIIYEEQNMEADDMIYSTCQTLGKDYGSVVIFSNDRDLAHNVSENTVIEACSPSGVRLSLSTYMDAFGGLIPYNSVLASKVFMGDKSDSIRVLNIPNKTSKAAFNDYVSAVRSSLPKRSMFALADRRVLEWYVKSSLPPSVHREAFNRISVIFPRLCSRPPIVSNLDSINLSYLSHLASLYKDMPYTSSVTKKPADKDDYSFISNLYSQVMDGGIAVENNLPDSLVYEDEEVFDMWGE